MPTPPAPKPTPTPPPLPPVTVEKLVAELLAVNQQILTTLQSQVSLLTSLTNSLTPRGGN